MSLRVGTLVTRYDAERGVLLCHDLSGNAGTCVGEIRWIDSNDPLQVQWHVQCFTHGAFQPSSQWLAVEDVWEIGQVPLRSEEK